MHHLDVVAGPIRPHVTAARLAIHLCRDFAKNRRDHFVGFARSAGHQRRTFERSLFSTGNTAADKVNALPLEFLATALRIGEKRIPSVDNDVASFQERGQFGNHLIDRFAGFDHDHRLSRALQRANEIFYRCRREDVFPLSARGGKPLRHGRGAIKNCDGESFGFHIEDEVFAHHGQPDQPNIRLRRHDFAYLVSVCAERSARQ